MNINKKKKISTHPTFNDFEDQKREQDSFEITGCSVSARSQSSLNKKSNQLTIKSVDQQIQPVQSTIQDDLPAQKVHWGLNIRSTSTATTGGPSIIKKLLDTQQAKKKNSQQNLPNLPNQQTYKEIPVDEFGSALLRGLGWKDGFGIGRYSNMKESEILPIKQLTGPLQATEALQNSAKQKIGLGALHHQTKNEAFVQKNPKVEIQEGKSDEFSVKFDWIMPNLKVRLIDKKLTNSLYLQKGIIMDDIYRANDCRLFCSLLFPNGHTLHDVDQRSIESVIPSVDKPVVILTGKYRGQFGSLLQIRREKQTVILQLIDDMDVVMEYDFDQVCEYIHPDSANVR